MDYIDELYKAMAKHYDEQIINDIAELLLTKYGLNVDKDLLMDVFKDYATVASENGLKETYMPGAIQRHYKKKFLFELGELAIHKMRLRPNDLYFKDALYETYIKLDKENRND